MSNKWKLGPPDDVGIYEYRPRFWPGKVKTVAWFVIGGVMSYRTLSSLPGDGTWNEENWTCWLFEYRRVS